MITVESGKAFVFERMRARTATAAGGRISERHADRLGVKYEYHLHQTFRESSCLRPPKLSATNTLSDR
jgi:hypothetical protein